MAEPITAMYVQSEDDWTITVSGREEQRSAKAADIVAARDRADELVRELTADGRPTVVHLLNGSALDFTEAYMTAKLTRPEIAPLEIPPPGSSKQAPPPKPTEDTASAIDTASTKDTASIKDTASTKDTAPTKNTAATEDTAPEPEKAKAEKPPLPQGKELPKAIEPRKPSEAADVVKPPAAARQS
jgi:hypothetical protein